jgi:hypothetical protein
MKACDVRAAMKALERLAELDERIEHLENPETALTVVLTDVETGEELGTIDGIDEALEHARGAMLHKLIEQRTDVELTLTALGVTDLDALPVAPLRVVDDADAGEEG